MYISDHIEKVASLCHELNKAICTAKGDFSQLPWELTPDVIKNSAIQGVKTVLENPDITPEGMHQKWVDYKISEGWVYGPIKDVDAKTHPLLIPYEELDFEDRVKDYVFLAAVKYGLRI